MSVLTTILDYWGICIIGVYVLFGYMYYWGIHINMFVYIHGLWELELSPEVEVFHRIQQEYLPLM